MSTTTNNSITYPNGAGGYGVSYAGGMAVLHGTSPAQPTTQKTSVTPSYSGGYAGPSSYTVQVPYKYYKEEAATVDYNGAMLAQTFVIPRAGWGKAIGLFFKTIAAAGAVHLFVVGCTNGKPDMQKVVSKVTLQREDLKPYPQETKFPLPAFPLESGERAGVVIVSEGSHTLVLGEASFTEGTFFYGTDGAFFQGDIGKDIKFKFYMARFRQARTEIQLQPVSLAGGVGELFLVTEQPVPAGSSLTYEIQVAGLWKPLTELGHLATLPDIVPLRAVFVGTSDVQPGLKLGANRIRGGRRATSEILFSEVIELAGSDKQNYVLDIDIENYSDDKHTLTPVLLTGAPAYSTSVSASSVTEKLLADGKTTRLRASFNTGSPVGDLKVRYTLTRTSDGAACVVRERNLVAVS